MLNKNIKYSFNIKINTFITTNYLKYQSLKNKKIKLKSKQIIFTNYIYNYKYNANK